MRSKNSVVILLLFVFSDIESRGLPCYNSDTVYNIEMQNGHHKNLPKRTRYYQGMIDLNLLDKGMDYTQLKQSFVIFVCTFDPFHIGRHVYTFENRCVEDPNLPSTMRNGGMTT